MSDPSELSVGIDGRISSVPGFPGSIKDKISDFIVEEIPDPSITRSEDGKYGYLMIKLTDWDTNKFLSRLAKELHISRKRITYAGTKDKRGITVQYFCVNSRFSPDEIRISDAEVLEYFRSDHFLKLGDLVGNRFTIRISSEGERENDIREIYASIMRAGGFPNFFGMQRFGSMRRNTHKIGKYIVQGDYRKAVETYIYDPEFDTEDFRVRFGETHDAAEALKDFPLRLTFERSILGYIQESGNFEGAFSAFPKNLGMLFVHAYQSYIFNRILSERHKAMGDLNEAVPGDIAYAVDQYFNPVDREEIKVNRYNTDKINRLIGEDRLRLTIPLIGYESRMTDNFQGEIERKIMEEEKVLFPQFRIGGYPELSSKGDRRIISAKPLDFEYTGDNTMKFSLGRGIYATSFLREFLKQD